MDDFSYAEDLEAVQDEQDRAVDVAEERRLREELFRRCHASSISYEEAPHRTNSDDRRPNRRPIRVIMPAGRTTRDVFVLGNDEIQQLLSIPFEDYVFLKGYDAICSYRGDIIEARITPASNRPVGTSAVLERIWRVGNVPDRESADPYQIEFSSSDLSGLSLRLGQASDTFFALTRLGLRIGSDILRTHGSLRRRPTIPTLIIKGLGITQHDHAVQALTKLSSSLFMELDLAFDLPLTLARPRHVSPRRISERTQSEIIDLQFPRSEYDESPMSLYWYARGSRGMPLLQFLAFYQVLEYYFPMYSDREAQQRLQNILKDPTFNAHNSTHVARLLQVIKSTGGRGFGDERSQLESVLLGCIDPSDLWEFAISDEDRRESLSKGKAKLSETKLPLKGAKADIRTGVAQRIYDIRCKIVHTKSGSSDTEVELLLPFSEEADALGHDIDLVQFLAQKVLIANSRPLRLKL